MLSSLSLFRLVLLGNIRAPAGVRVCLEIQLAAAAIGYVRVELRSREIGMAEHFLNTSEVGPALEEVRREGMPEQVRVDALRLEPGALGESAEDQEGASAGERAAAGVEEELGPVPAVEERSAVRQVAPECLGSPAPDRNDALLGAFPDAADDPHVEVDAALLEGHRFGHAQA